MYVQVHKRSASPPPQLPLTSSSGQGSGTVCISRHNYCMIPVIYVILYDCRSGGTVSCVHLMSHDCADFIEEYTINIVTQLQQGNDL